MMKEIDREVLQYVEEENVQFIRLAFCDVFGKQKNIAIQPSELERAFDSGIPIDGSAIAGFCGDVRSDLFLHPYAGTLSGLPWRSIGGKVVRMLCRVAHPDGKTIEGDTRELLRTAVKTAEARGIHFFFGPEMEFYLFQTDENGASTRIPYDNAHYMDISPLDKGENIRREICLTLEQMGIHPECSHHEEGPGQNEIDFRYSDAVTAADNAITFRTVVETIVARDGLCADFSPKPLLNEPGNGLHINISVKSDDGRDLLPYVVAGILGRIYDFTAFLNPTDASYLRLGSRKAPGYISWGAENRSQMIRIPAAVQGTRRAELRSADSTLNPYIAFALLIHAGLYGIEKQLPLPETEELNLYTASREQLSSYRSLPKTREEAVRAALESAFVRSHLPQAVLSAYCS